MNKYSDRPLWRKCIAMFAAATMLPSIALAQTPSAAPQPAGPGISAAAASGQNAPASLERGPQAQGPAPQGNALPHSPASTPPPEAVLRLPRDLSPWGMFMAADIVVKAVMIGLAFASVLSWTIWLAKALDLLITRRRLRHGLRALSEAHSLHDVLTRLHEADGEALAFAQSADAELRLSAEALTPEGVKERIASRLSRLEAAGSRRMIRGVGIIGTIGATAPFVGLFGTVWGIMNSFIGISKLHTTNLAVVAPGIAEALLATALGLVAAIPAVMMYNMFSRWIAGYRALQADASAATLRLVSRDLDRGVEASRWIERRRPAAE